jgi:hypothetical protein
MEATVTTANSEEKLGAAIAANGTSYGKLMMWFSSYQML